MTILTLIVLFTRIPHLTLDFPTIGGGAGIATASLWALREVLGWLDRRRTAELTEDSQNVAATSSAVADAATVNAVMLANIKALHDEVDRVHVRNRELTEQNAKKDHQIGEMQKEIERLVHELGNLYQRLDDLKSR